MYTRKTLFYIGELGNCHATKLTYCRVLKVAAMATFKISDLEGRLLSKGCLHLGLLFSAWGNLILIQAKYSSQCLGRVFLLNYLGVTSI